MKRRILAVALVAILGAAPARAVPVEALAWVTGVHGFTVADGTTPEGILFSTGGPAFDAQLGAGTAIDAPDAALAFDTVDVQIGDAVVEPPVPYLDLRRQRTNRADPTEFALAETDLSVTSSQSLDAGAFALGEREIRHSGLAQLRLTSQPVAASAGERHGIARVHTFENRSPRQIAFNIFGGFDIDLTARVSGGGGFARSTTVLEWIVDGIAPEDLLYVPLDTYFLIVDDGAPGATVTESLTATPSGTSGVLFSGAATAVGNGGFTEARLQAAHDFILRLTLDPGEVATMRAGFVQANAVEFAPPGAQVPLPAPLALLAGALALLGLLRRGS